MNDRNRNDRRGFKPHLVRDMLALPKERFRNWRNKLDPNPHKAYFSATDLLAYRVMKALIDKHSVPVEYLSNIDFSEIFVLFASTDRSELKNKVIALDRNTDTLNIVANRIEAFELLRNGILLVFVDELLAEQIDAFMDYGQRGNVVPITKAVRV